MKEKYFIISFLMILNISAFAQFGQVSEESSKNKRDTLQIFTKKYDLPSIGISAGNIYFCGDLGNRKGDFTFNTGAGIFVQQKFAKTYLSASFDAITGKISQNYDKQGHKYDFETNIFQCNISLNAYLNKILGFSRASKFSPFVSIGVGYITFNPKANLKDENGDNYIFRPDGTITDKNGNITERDNNFETKLDSTNSYNHYALCSPFGIGIEYKLSKRFSLKVSSIYYFTKTDNIDSNPGNTKFNVENKHDDGYLYSSISFLFNLSRKIKIERPDMYSYRAISPPALAYSR